MTRPSVVFLLWGLFLALVAAVEWAIFTHHTPNYYLLVLLPACAIGGAVALAALAAAHRRRRKTRARPTVVVELSMPSALIGIAVAVMLWGSFIGEWLLLIGAGLLVLGVGGVSRELVYARRLHRAASVGESEQSGRT
jgi:hypothetical protein